MRVFNFFDVQLPKVNLLKLPRAEYRKLDMRAS